MIAFIRRLLGLERMAPMTDPRDRADARRSVQRVHALSRKLDHLRQRELTVRLEVRGRR